MAQVSLKVFNRSVNETRRLSVDESVCSNYFFINEKIQTIFPNLRGANFKLTWKDTDGDYVRITGDEDLITAFTEMGNTKVLYVDSEPNQSANGCPYSGTFDLKSLHALARQYLEPLMASPQGEQVAETIRNLAAGFLSKQQNAAGGNEAGCSQAQSAEQKVEEGLKRLQEMGFKDDPAFVRKLLEHLNGDVEGVIRILSK
uniref:UBA domain-containing protein n=1 Tax=Photinus pyralis TaxID=7054 RepID=A0A1Y1KP02_PHOPY